MAAGNAINTFLINNGLIHPAALHLLLIRTAVLYDPMHGLRAAHLSAAPALLLRLRSGFLFTCGRMELLMVQRTGKVGECGAGACDTRNYFTPKTPP